MPVYDAGVYLNPALESPLKQALKEIAIIADDDGSANGLRLLLAEYDVHNRRLKVTHQKKRRCFRRQQPPEGKTAAETDAGEAKEVPLSESV